MALTTTLRAQGAAFTPTTLFDALDLVLVSPVDFVSQDSNSTTTSSSYATIGTMTSTVTVETGDVVEIAFSCVCGVSGAASANWAIGLHQNGTLITGGDAAMTHTNAGTDFAAYATTVLVEAPATGSVTYTAQFKRISGTGTVNVSYKRMSIKVMRNA